MSDLDLLDRGLLTTYQSGGCPKIDVVVASIADPIDSGLGYQFDTQLQALRLGAEHNLGAGSFYRDRIWLPWDDRDAPADEHIASEECRRSVPGLLLFRSSSGDPPQFLALLLVGETPTSGVHPGAMNTALGIASRLLSGGCEPSNLLRLVGPTFSGSAASLRRALGSWYSANPRSFAEVRIRTGSATGSALPRLLNSSKTWLTQQHVSFSGTTAPEDAVQCGYLSFLHHRLGVPAEDGSQQLSEVALLHESGTEFGATLRSSTSCSLQPAVDISFPIHISLLRDAYEEMDQQARVAEAKVARRTSLDISLREPRRPLDLPAEPSPKATYSRDVALAHVLGTISRRGVRHVGIQATDIGDAIFLARKIRDVAPDVRIAFFTSDMLLLHSGLQRDLGGSLVVTPYPFLGSSGLATAPSAEEIRPHDAFENGTSLGIFNAMLVSRGAQASQLREYTFGDPTAVLPIWTSAIGNGSFIPISVVPSRDPDGSIEAGIRQRALSNSAGAPPPPYDFASERKEFARSELRVEEGTKLPRLWHFVFALFCVVTLIDWFAQRRTLVSLSQHPLPKQLNAANDAQAELAMGRTKWRLYAAIRSYVLAFGLSYMAMLYLLAMRAYSGSAFGYSFSEHPWLQVTCMVVIAAVAMCAVIASARSAFEFARDYAALGRCVRGRSPLTWLSRCWGKYKKQAEPVTAARAILSEQRNSDGPPRSSLMRIAGFGDPYDRLAAAGTSFSQLRMLANLALALALFFTIGELGVLWCDARWDQTPGAAMPSTTLLVMRSLPLVGSVSPSAPTLVYVAIVYVWAVGRMSRLALAHGVSRMSPQRSVYELVSTPIRVILHPGSFKKGGSAEAFTTTERAVLNAILRPITGPHYCAALAVSIFLPIVLFILKPPSTLERFWGTCLLAAGLALCVLLIGNTLIQLVQYWVALERMLKLILQHRLGRAFTRAASFVRDSVEDQVSRAPHDLMRLSSCVTRLDELVRATSPLGSGILTLEEHEALKNCREVALDKRESALCLATRPARGPATEAEALLGCEVIEAAAVIVGVLTRAWDGPEYPNRPYSIIPPPPNPAGQRAAPASEAPPASQAPPLSTDEALSAEAWRHWPSDLRWLRDAEAFAATVSALLINRHVRQFQYFVYTLTGSTLLLLLAFSGYPFEPRRLLLTCLWAIVCSVVLAGLGVFLEIDRNSLLSRIAGTEPGKLTWDGAFFLRVVTWGLVPLLSVAAVQYPDLANSLFRLAEPLTRALR